MIILATQSSYIVVLPAKCTDVFCNWLKADDATYPALHIRIDKSIFILSY